MKQSISILHVLRAPVGGLFRHVVDLAAGQVSRGHRVGLITDSLTADLGATETLQKFRPLLENGVALIPITRSLGLRDAVAVRRIGGIVDWINPDVVHGHGAKGGAFARLVGARRDITTAYTPHGGSLLLKEGSLSAFLYTTLERVLMPFGSVYLFESEYSARVFQRRIGTPDAICRVVHNGVADNDFEPTSVAVGATDLLFIGELRAVKGARILLDAISLLHGRGCPVTATVVGDGPEKILLERYAEKCGVAPFVSFVGSMNARDAMGLGQVVVVPSLAESLPYVVLEAAAAGRPLVATKVGGIPEIFGTLQPELVEPGTADDLAKAISRKLENPSEAIRKAASLRDRVWNHFRVDMMVDGVQQAYFDAIGDGKRKSR